MLSFSYRGNIGGLGDHFIDIFKVDTYLAKLDAVPEGVDFGDRAGQLVVALTMGTVVYHGNGCTLF